MTTEASSPTPGESPRGAFARAPLRLFGALLAPAALAFGFSEVSYVVTGKGPVDSWWMNILPLFALAAGAVLGLALPRWTPSLLAGVAFGLGLLTSAALHGSLNLLPCAVSFLALYAAVFVIGIRVIRFVLLR